MSALIAFPDGGFSFLEGVFPYSQGVAALPGFAIERVRFARPVPVAQGFDLVSKYLKNIQRPLTALCAAELRSPKPFTFSGFGEFNKGYVAVLEQWGLYRNGKNPVARSNVAPEIDPPAEPCFYAFCYTVPSQESGSFVVAGSGEWPEGGHFPEDIVARGDVSPAGMAKKADWVLGIMDARLKGLGASWSRATVSQLYTVQDVKSQIGRIQEHIGPSSLTWHYCRPPIAELEFEMDLRGVSLERVL
ncbi:MAG: hypothetical protein EXR33_02540 [Betaproteobacteria bacterium]|nr:hypothetical protein [Betaproteobacteria bacterium]